MDRIALALGAWLLVGCAVQGTEPARTAAAAAAGGSTAARSAATELPAPLESLTPSAEQRRALVALRDSLEGDLEPVAEAGRELALAVAKAARRCNADTIVVESASSWLVQTADRAWPSLLDSIDRLHEILTPAQRKALSDRLLGREKESQSDEPTDEGARAFGDRLDLSVGQMFKLLTRALALRGALEEQLEPWRERARRALVAFPRADFAIRDHEIAEVPAAAIATGLLQDGLAVLLPILEPAQCAALAELIEREVAEQERAARERPRAPSTGGRPGGQEQRPRAE